VYPSNQVTQQQLLRHVARSSWPGLLYARLTASLRGWSPDDHVAYFVRDLAISWICPPCWAGYEAQELGYPTVPHSDDTKVLVYACCVGVFSSRRIQRRLLEGHSVRVLAAANEPHFPTIADFRKRPLLTLQ